MHRSGTSFLAGLLQANGVDIGTQLMAASDSNPKRALREYRVPPVSSGCAGR